MSLTRMNVMRAVASGAAPAKRMPPIGASKRPVARRRVMRNMMRRCECPADTHFRSKIRFFRDVFAFEVAGYPAPGGLQTVDEGHHPVALVRIRQTAAHCTKIVGHMRWI